MGIAVGVAHSLQRGRASRADSGTQRVHGAPGGHNQGAVRPGHTQAGYLVNTGVTAGQIDVG